MQKGRQITIYLPDDQIAWLDLRVQKEEARNRSQQIQDALTTKMMDVAAKRLVDTPVTYCTETNSRQT